MIFGIVGGIGSGKSAVARLFAEAGCETIDADTIAHAVLETTPVRDRIRERFGEAVLDPDGGVDRRALAAHVFRPSGSRRDDSALKDLEAITHPPVREKILEEVAAHQSSGSPAGILVLDVSLLASSPLRHRCDAIVLVDVDRETRLQRCRQRGWDRDELDRREARQATLDEKRSLARWTIDNSGTIEETRSQVRHILEESATIATERPAESR